MLKLFKRIGKNNVKESKEDYEAVKKAVLEAVSKDLNGNRIFNPDKYNKMCNIKYSNKGEPIDMVVTVKRMVEGRVVSEQMSMKENYDNPRLHEVLFESSCLDGGSLYFNGLKNQHSTGSNFDYNKMVPINNSGKDGYSSEIKRCSKINSAREDIVNVALYRK